MTPLTDMVDYEVRGGVALLVIDNPPVNALSHGVRAGMVEGLAKAAADDGVAAVLLVCKGRTFIAGADITEFGKPMKEPGLNEAIEAMENASKPVIAAIHGTALGGGLETAMACHYRVGVASARFGQPEVKLGLLPGAGGTQRLPRLVGYQKALEMCAVGNPFGAREALEGGLIDEIVDDVFEGGVAFAEKVIAEDRPLKKIRDLEEKINEARANRKEIFDGFRRKIARRTRGFDAPEANVRAIEAGLDMSFDDALDYERRLFADLMAGKQSIAQRYYFFAEREAAKVPDVPRDTQMRKIEKVGVLGCGTMGGGISMNFANRGIGVTIVEAEQSRIDHGFGVIRKNYERTAKRGRMTMDQVDECMGRLNGVTDREALADCDLVIEAVFENMDLKKDIFASLDRIVKPGAILATNTSALDVNEIASATSRPEDVIGMHFFSPANIMRLLEVVRGEKTAKDVIHTSMVLSKQIGKVPVLVGVCRGFVGNRILFQRQTQAQRIILEGAKYYDVDSVSVQLRLPHGPLRDERPRRPRHRLEREGVGVPGHPRPPVRVRPPRSEERPRLLRLRPGDPRLSARSGGLADHQRLRLRPGHRPARDRRGGDPRALPLPHGQRGCEDPGRRDRDSTLRHRRDLGQRLRLADLPGWPDALGRQRRSGKGGRSDARVRRRKRR